MLDKVKLLDLYQVGPSLSQLEFLYSLLKSRDPIANISHGEMPTHEQHTKFVFSRPYEAWYLIGLYDENNSLHDYVGAIYLSKAREIGISIRTGYRHRGIGRLAALALMRRHPGAPFLANIAPKNERSIRFFEALGFKLKQLTFEVDATEMTNSPA